LHDGVGPLLSLIKLQASGLEASDANKKTIADIKSLASDSIKEVRNISHALMPSLLESKGLQSALEEFTEQINETGALNVELKFAVGAELSQDIQVNIYRIVQEAVNNSL